MLFLLSFTCPTSPVFFGCVPPQATSAKPSMRQRRRCSRSSVNSLTISRFASTSSLILPSRKREGLGDAAVPEEVHPRLVGRDVGPDLFGPTVVLVDQFEDKLGREVEPHDPVAFVPVDGHGDPIAGRQRMARRDGVADLQPVTPRIEDFVSADRPRVRLLPAGKGIGDRPVQRDDVALNAGYRRPRFRSGTGLPRRAFGRAWQNLRFNRILNAHDYRYAPACVRLPRPCYRKTAGRARRFVNFSVTAASTSLPRLSPPPARRRCTAWPGRISTSASSSRTAAS